MAAALPRPLVAPLLPPLTLTFWAMFKVPANAWSPLMLTQLLPLPFRLNVPVAPPAARLLKVCVWSLAQVNVAPFATLRLAL